MLGAVRGPQARRRSGPAPTPHARTAEQAAGRAAARRAAALIKESSRLPARWSRSAVGRCWTTPPSRGPAGGWCPSPRRSFLSCGCIWRCSPSRESTGRVFTGPNGGPLKHSGFRRTWDRTRKTVGLPGLHFHDLRHIGNTLAASAGASLKELMSRMGHSSTQAALIYQHASRDRDKVIAKALGQAFKRARAGGHEKPSGTQRARKIIKFP
ncbi:tyrosine-type recombinase/integrase [Streptosporangium sp. G11]|uniref:tyrosine-type recombinase/integrase n=1 Tax=Streptosporangium sp. G11 TaxID=3436926 RepID=UPI003EC02D50